MVGTTRQGLHKHNRKHSLFEERAKELLQQVHAVRSEHPVMGARKIYQILAPGWIGRDRFEQLLLDNGLRVKHPKNYKRTTHAQRVYDFPNLISGLELNGPNQLWQTDITYYRLGERFYYITLIVDVWLRMIVGHAVSDNMKAEANVIALKMAIKNTRKYGFEQLIHHSDHGRQFIFDEYLKLLAKQDITISMCYSALENAYVERLNGIIKNEYLKHFHIENYQALKKLTAKVVDRYNRQRPHGSLPGGMTPVQYEESGLNVITKLFNFSTDINKEKRSKKEILH